MNKPDQKKKAVILYIYIYVYVYYICIYNYFIVLVDDGFEQDREFNLKRLKCFDNVPFLFVVINCFGDIEQDDAPSTDDDGEEFCWFCGDDEYRVTCWFDEWLFNVVNNVFALLL